ncbi:MAG: DUF3303 domain-containing protein [Candidatus Thorarchaeota archaeon]
MKYLVEWHIKPKHRKEAVKAADVFKQPKEMKTILAAHQCVASNRGVAVIDVDDVKLIHDTFRDMLSFMEFKVTPVIPLFSD